MTHAHITTWLLALILFFIALSLHRSGKAKGLKIVHMILRLFYLLIIATGVGMLFSISTISSLYIIKALVGILVIGFFEMVLVRTIKGKPTGMFWTLFIISFIVVLYLGFSMPLGFYFL
jgi:hypothetical protein